MKLPVLKINCFSNLSNKNMLKIFMLTAMLYLTFKSNLDRGFKKYGISKIDYVSYQFLPVFHFLFNLIVVSNKTPLRLSEISLKVKIFPGH